MDAFTCKICKDSPIEPPIILYKCCKTIIGCESCINFWYSGEAGEDATTKNMSTLLWREGLRCFAFYNLSAEIQNKKLATITWFCYIHIFIERQKTDKPIDFQFLIFQENRIIGRQIYTDKKAPSLNKFCSN